ncbi:MAG TPA: LysM domain-containing protein [Candidatus Limnocylindrales bacterium]|jgi:hypothetical protein
MTRRSRLHATDLGWFIVAALVAAVAIGCLPSGGRGARSEPAAGVATAAPITPSPTPSGPTPVPSFVPPTPTPYPTFMVYVVARGDSLNTIAHKFSTTARSLAFWNRSTYPTLDPESPKYRPSLLQVGWTLFLVPNLVVNEDELPADSPSADVSEP